jgi:hypothetical protein
MYREFGGYGSTTVPCFTKSCWTRMGWYVDALSWINIQEFTAYLCGWVYQTVCYTQCSTYIYLSLFMLALLEMISLCMILLLLKNIFRFTFLLEQSWQHSIFHGDVGDFNWFTLYLASLITHHDVTQECGIIVHRWNGILTFAVFLDAALLSGQGTMCGTLHDFIRSLTLILLMCRIGWAPNSILIYIQQDATLHSLFISGNCSTCFRWYFHPSSGAHTTVSTASGICCVCCGWRMPPTAHSNQFQLFHNSGR